MLRQACGCYAELGITASLFGWQKYNMGMPALNDSTIEDAEMVSMTRTVKVITTGLAMPAAILPLCSKEFLDEYNKADLIIAKGQGNYEALRDENKNIFFLLKIKCPAIAENFNGKYKVGDIVVDRSTVIF